MLGGFAVADCCMMTHGGRVILSPAEVGSQTSVKPQQQLQTTDWQVNISLKIITWTWLSLKWLYITGGSGQRKTKDSCRHVKWDMQACSWSRSAPVTGAFLFSCFHQAAIQAVHSAPSCWILVSRLSQSWHRHTSIHTHIQTCRYCRVIAEAPVVWGAATVHLHSHMVSV